MTMKKAKREAKRETSTTGSAVSKAFEDSVLRLPISRQEAAMFILTGIAAHEGSGLAAKADDVAARAVRLADALLEALKEGS